MSTETQNQNPEEGKSVVAEETIGKRGVKTELREDEQSAFEPDEKGIVIKAVIKENSILVELSKKGLSTVEVLGILTILEDRAKTEKDCYLNGNSD